jgi:DNA-directed RNA polymerase subunit omega
VARITVEDSLRKVPSRFELVHLTAQRVRQIREGSEYLVISPKNEDIVIALREIAAGKVTMENMEKAGKVLFSSDVDMLPEEDLAEIAGEFKTEAVDTEEDDDLDTTEEDETDD